MGDEGVGDGEERKTWREGGSGWQKREGKRSRLLAGDAWVAVPLIETESTGGRGRRGREKKINALVWVLLSWRHLWRSHREQWGLRFGRRV